jgi:hypothetical protein
LRIWDGLLIQNNADAGLEVKVRRVQRSSSTADLVAHAIEAGKWFVKETR